MVDTLVPSFIVISNISISLTNLEYLHYLNQEKIVLKQRNSYLKQLAVNGNMSLDYLDILTEKLVDYGMYIYEKRQQFLLLIQKYLGDIFEQITGLKGLVLEYISNYKEKSKEEILDFYKKNLKRDISFGKTNFGVHVDDFRFLLNGKDLRDYGSEGQQKNAIIAYKFSELEIFKELTNCYPIFILDDLFSELDKEKVQNILKLLKEDVQTFVTTTDLSNFVTLRDFSYKSFHITNGKIVEESEHERG